MVHFDVTILCMKYASEYRVQGLRYFTCDPRIHMYILFLLSVKTAEGKIYSEMKKKIIGLSRKGYVLCDARAETEWEKLAQNLQLKVGLQSYPPPPTPRIRSGSWAAVSAVQNFTAAKLQLHFGGGGGGSDCSHFRTSLQPNFSFTSVGGGFQLQSLQNFTVAKLTVGGGGSDCIHFRTSLQPNFNFTSGGGSNCSSLQNFTADKLQLHFRGLGGPTAVTSELHCRQTSTSLGGDLCTPESFRPEHGLATSV